VAKIFGYLVYRHGANTANQSMCDKMPLCFVEANSRQIACDKAVQKHTFYSNQVPSAIPLSKAPRGDIRVVNERQAVEFAYKKEETL
jgi:hypothetical protein